MSAHGLYVGALAVVGAIGLSTSLLAADLPAKAPVYKAPAAIAPSWTGFYAGLNAGYGWSSAATDETATASFLVIPAQSLGLIPTSLSPHMNGFVGGGQLGYNWQVNRYVVGLEADIAYSAMRGEASLTTSTVPYPTLVTTQTNKVTWLGTLRPRLGWLWTPSTLVYATGGLAYGGIKATTTIDVPGACPNTNAFCSVGSASKTHAGWTIGGGGESIIASNWTAKLDYLYFDLGSVSYSVVSTAPLAPLGGTEIMRADAKFNGHIVRVGFNYKFN